MKPSLISWYEKHGRHDLPWRNTKNTYHIYLSEIMLQQTQVKTVLDRFYFQFLEQFPTIESLANAKEEDVLKAWEGLGYYSRARNLYKTAKIVQTHLPNNVEELCALPGIGLSTAHAIACFAFAVKVPILDGNVKRILYRYFAKKKANDKELWKMSYEIFNEEFAYEHNQAMMDIGSMICTIRNPKCHECPFFEKCLGKDEALFYPTKKKKKQKEKRNREIVVYTCKDKFALCMNDSNLLKGLWSFIQYEELEESDEFHYLDNITHEYSHISLKARVFTKEIIKKKSYSWFTKAEIETLPLSKLDRNIFELFKSKKLY